MKTTIRKFIAYYRVSTQKQAASGLGLEAQRKDVESFAKSNGGKIVAEYIETETGKVANRPKLTEAIAHSRLAKATLVVAKLDRLARNVEFTATLMNSGIEFVACDNPHMNRLTIHVLAAVAEAEAVSTGRRTKDALAAAKARGTLLGSARPDHWKGREHKRGWKQGAKAAGVARSLRVREVYSFLLPMIKQLQAAGNSYGKIAQQVNELGHETVYGKPFTATAIWRIVQRAQDDSSEQKPKRKASSA